MEHNWSMTCRFLHAPPSPSFSAARHAARKTAAGYEDLQKSAAHELEQTRAELAAKKSALDDINARLAAIAHHAE